MQMKYYSIFIYYVIAILIAIVLYIVWYIKVYQNLDLEKVSSYECGFNPLEDAFDVQIYMVALLFIIFDFLLSWLGSWLGAKLDNKFFTNSCKSFITTIFIFSLDRKFFTTSCKIVGIFWWIKAEVMGFFSFFLIKLDRKFLIMKEFTLFSWIKAQVMGFFLIKLFSLVIKSIFCKITVICKEFINGLKRLIHLFLKFVGSNVKKYGGVGTMIGGSENKDKADQLNKVEHFNNLTDQWTVYGYDYRLPLIVIGTVIGIGGICYGCYRVYKNYKKGDNDDGSVSSISKLRRQKPKKEKSSTAEINKAEIVSTTAQGVDEKVDVVNTTGEEVKVDDKVEVVNTTGEEVKVDDKVEVVNTTGEEVKVDDKVEVSPEVNTTGEEVKVDDKVEVSPEVNTTGEEVKVDDKVEVSPEVKAEMEEIANNYKEMIKERRTVQEHKARERSDFPWYFEELDSDEEETGEEETSKTVEDERELEEDVWEEENTTGEEETSKTVEDERELEDRLEDVLKEAEVIIDSERSAPSTTSMPSTMNLPIRITDEAISKVIFEQIGNIGKEVIEIKKIKKYELKEPVTLTYIKPTSNTTVAKNVVRLQAEHSLFPCDVGTDIKVGAEYRIEGKRVKLGECTILKNVVIKKGNVTKEINEGINLDFYIRTYKKTPDAIYILFNSKLKEILWFMDGKLKNACNKHVMNYINVELKKASDKMVNELLTNEKVNSNFKGMLNDLIGLSKSVICNTYEELRLNDELVEDEIQIRFSLTLKELETTYTNYMINRFQIKDVNEYNEINRQIVEVINQRVNWIDYKKLVHDKSIIINKVWGNENLTRCTELSWYLMWEQRKDLNYFWAIQIDEEINFLDDVLGTTRLGLITEKEYNEVKKVCDEGKKNMEIIPYIINKKEKTGRTGNTGIVQEVGMEVSDTTSYEEDLVMLMANNMEDILAPLFFIMNCDECLRFWIIYMIQIFLAFYMQIRNDYVHLYGQEGREIWETMGFWKLFYLEYQDNVNIPEEVLKKGVIKIIWFDIKRNIKCKVNEEWNELKRNVKVLKRNVQEDWTDLKNLKIKVKEIGIKNAANEVL